MALLPCGPDKIQIVTMRTIGSNLRLILCVAYLGLACYPAYAAQAEHGIMVRVANIYLSPDPTSAKLGEVERGREVAILEKSRDWLHVLASLTTERDVT